MEWRGPRARQTIGFETYGCLLPMLTLVVAAGCGSRSESTVSGQVSLNGSFLDHGYVTFSPVESGGGGHPASGQINGSGAYEVQAGTSGGLPAGQYKVTVHAREPSKPNADGRPPTPGRLVTPKKYSRADTTDLIVEVKPGRNSIDLKLVSE